MHKINWSQLKWPKIKLRTFLQLALLVCILGIAVIGFLLNPSSKSSVKLPPAQPWTTFLFSIYGAPGVDMLHPMSVYADDAKGLIYVANTERHRIDVYDRQGSFKFSFGSFGSEAGQLSFPYGVAKMANGNLLVTEAGNNRIQEFDEKGKSRGFLVDSSNGFGMQKPGVIRIDSKGKVYVGDLSAGKVFVISPEGRALRTISGIDYPHGLALDETHNIIYVASSTSGTIKSFPLEKVDRKGGSYPTYSNLGLIRGIACDARGYLYVVNSNQGSVQVFNETGYPMLSFGTRGNENGQMLYPNGIDISTEGRIYIADWGNSRIVVWGSGV